MSTLYGLGRPRVLSRTCSICFQHIRKVAENMRMVGGVAQRTGDVYQGVRKGV